MQTSLRVEHKVEYKNNIDELIDQLENLENLEIAAGWFGTKHKSESGQVHNTAQIAYWLNYGTKGMPPRPFMDTAFIAFRRRALRDLAKMINKAYKLQNPNLLIGETAKAFEQTIRRVMDAPPADFPPLSQTTLEWKAPETRMFYETGQLMDQLTTKVKKKKKRIREEDKL